ncbi:MAG: hypothetical protein HC880_19215 [Bacteroidia bacterium]|nr:hypothetical protein [Bacteroidia bacterium]
MARKETTTVYHDSGTRNTYVLIGLIALAAILALVVAYMAYTQANLKSTNLAQQNIITKLQEDSVKFSRNLAELKENEVLLNQQIEELQLRKDRLISERDSVARLLAYSRTNERNAQAKIAVLQKRLNELQAKLNTVQRQYDELLANSGTSSGNFQQQVAQLTAERNALAEENQRLQRELATATGNADNRTAIFTTTMNAVPGELRRGRFSSSRRSQNVDRVEATFTLSRAPKPTENLIFRIFNNVNTEIPIKPLYRNELSAPADPTNQKVLLEFEGGTLNRQAAGEYTVRLYLTDVNKGLENQEIGLARFELR